MLRRNAILQIVELLRRFGSFENSYPNSLKFGTELELLNSRQVLVNGSKRYTVALSSEEQKKTMKTNDQEIEFHPEFAEFMLEITPHNPFFHFLNFEEVVKHLQIVKKVLSQTSSTEILQGMSVFPSLGHQEMYVTPLGRIMEPKKNLVLNTYSKSETFLDCLINDHSRFKSFTQNTRIRRTSKPQILIPVFQDEKTEIKQVEFDHFGIGMSCCAIQITYSTQNLDEARWLYDQFHCLSPFFIAATASSAIVGNYLMDEDVRLSLLM